jgi:hypothetical protein
VSLWKAASYAISTRLSSLTIRGYQFAEWPVAGGFAVVILKADAVVDNGFFKDVILFAESANFVGKEKVASFPAADVGEILHFEHDETIEVLVWEGIDENAVDDTKHVGGCTDAESEGENGDEGETMLLAEVAQCVA